MTIAMKIRRAAPGSLRLMICLLLCLPALCRAQKLKKDSVTHFRVKYLTGDYTFTPADGYLFAGSKNRLRICNSRKAKFEVKASNGKVTRVNDSTFVIEGLATTGATLLSCFEPETGGKKKLVVNKPFTVVPYPRVKFAGVACDSAMPAIMLAAGSMGVYYKSIGKKMPVTGFKMEMFEKGKFTLDSTSGNRLSKKMLDYVSKIKPGSLVYLSDVHYKDPNGNEHTEPVFRVFIVPDKAVLKFGVN
jgi:hypothetical protein